MKQVGTLKEIGAQVGDVVEGQGGVRPIYTVGVNKYGKLIDVDDGEELCKYTPFRIISSASDKPKLWRDMTPEEKGALLLAAHDGKVIEFLGTDGKWHKTSIDPKSWVQCAIRIKPEPKIETVNTHGAWSQKGQMPKTQYVYNLTFNLVDGVPDWTTARVTGK